MFGNILTECRIFKDPSDDLGGGINNIISSGLDVVVVVYLCGDFFLIFVFGFWGFCTQISTYHSQLPDLEMDFIA